MTTPCRLGLVLALAGVGGASAASLRIAAPSDGFLVAPGATLTVTVEADAGAYRQVVLIGQGPIGFSLALSAPPYRFTVQIPRRIKPRRYELTALGTIEPGKFDRAEPIHIQVEPADAPVECRVQPSVRMQLNPGERLSLRVVGVFPDGTEADLTESKWAAYRTDAPKVASVSNDGLVIANAPGNAQLRICGSVTCPSPSSPADRLERSNYDDAIHRAPAPTPPDPRL